MEQSFEGSIHFCYNQTNLFSFAVPTREHHSEEKLNVSSSFNEEDNEGTAKRTTKVRHSPCDLTAPICDIKLLGEGRKQCTVQGWVSRMSFEILK